MSDMWEAGCDPFENGYDPDNNVKLHRQRITELMAENDRLVADKRALEQSIGYWTDRAARFERELDRDAAETTKLTKERDEYRRLYAHVCVVNTDLGRKAQRLRDGLVSIQGVCREEIDENNGGEGAYDIILALSRAAIEGAKA